jgi:transcriptional regulator with XRE-family HTH domain
VYIKYAALRDKKGITDYRVSKETGISTSTLSNWKQGNYEPKLEKLLVLAKYFGVSVEYFANDASDGKGE